MTSTPPPGLIRLGESLPTGRYLSELWARRGYIAEVPLHSVRGAHLDTVLGNLWHLVNPALQMGVYYLIFGVMLETDRGVDNFIAFLALGVLPFRWFSNAVQNGATAITANLGLVRALRFPRAVLPISAYLEHTLAFIPSATVMFVIAAVTGEPLDQRWLMALPALLSLGLTTLGFTFIAARLTNEIADVKQLLPFVFRLLFYASGVLYLVEEWVQTEAALRWFALNPAYSAITALRWAVMDLEIRAEHIVSLIVWPLVSIPVGFTYFRRAEEDYGRG